jgi:glycosyltransferase involved in cell wall biosynthesis
MPRLLIDATASLINPKGVGRYAYHLCLQLARRLPADWSMHILVNLGNESVFPKDFRAELVCLRQRSEIENAYMVVPKLARRLRCEILLKTYESAGFVRGLRTVTVCHDIDKLIAQAQGPIHTPFRSALDAYKRLLRRRAMQHSEFVICNSQFTRDGVEREYRIPRNRTAVAYCAVDQGFYDLAPSVNAQAVCEKYGVERFILSFATGDRRENFRILPAVAAECATLGVETCILVAGIRPRGAYVDELRSEFLRRGLSEGKHFMFENFLGTERFPELVKLYSAADYYLELSLHEGFGMQLVEAMACGTTCISSPRGALAEIGGRYVFFADPTKPSEVAFTIKTAYEQRQQDRDNREQVQYTRQFSWGRAGSTVAAILERLAATQPALEVQSV